MKRFKLTGYVALFTTTVLLALTVAPMTALAAQPTVNLGTTDSFAILAGTTITNTGATTVNGSAGGDIGLAPGSDFPGQADVTLSGAVHISDAVATAAKTDLVAAYDDAAGRTPVTRIATELGNQTLKSGVYDSASGAFQITGTLTLDAEGDPNAVFIFLTDSTLITASSSTVRGINGARYCRVFWKVGSSATLGTNSNFMGHIFALTSISAKTGAVIQGQLLARNGAVTLDHNTITNGICANASPIPLIRVVKSANDYTLPVGGGPVTYTYKVTNPSVVDLTDVTVTDDKLATVTYVSGDVNDDQILQHSETWVYTASTSLTKTVSNTATAKGTGGGETVTDRMTVRVVVPATPTSTEKGGPLPTTATPWYDLLLVGFVLVMVSLVALAWRRMVTKSTDV